MGSLKVLKKKKETRNQKSNQPTNQTKPRKPKRRYHDNQAILVLLQISITKLNGLIVKIQPLNNYVYYIYLFGVGGAWVQLLGTQGDRARVILVLRECI